MGRNGTAPGVGERVQDRSLRTGFWRRDSLACHDCFTIGVASLPARAATFIRSLVTTTFADSRLDLGERAIDGGAGDDLRSEPVFDEIETEVRRMEIDGPNAVDWARVVQVSLDLVGTRSKDLLLATWATYGLFRRERYAGLAVGLSIIRGMMAAHWDGLQPPARRERARVGAIDWLVGRLATLVPDLAPQEEEDLAVIAAADALDDIDRIAGEKLQKEQLSVGELFRALRPFVQEARTRQKVLEEAEAARPAAAETAQADDAAAARPAAVSEPAPQSAPTTAGPAAATAAPLDLGSLPAALRDLAEAARRESASDSRAFLFRRLASFLRFEAVPAGEAGNRTLVAAPLDAIATLEAQRSAGQQAEALASAEEMVWTAPFYLDAHRHSAELLEALGPAFALARQTVIGMLAFIAQRHPGLTELCFSDGRPFADARTKALIGSGAAEGKGTAADPMAEITTLAREALAAARVDEAFAMLSEGLRGAGAGRKRFQAQLGQAEFCLDSGFLAAALPLLEHLEVTVEMRELEHWEPDLACRTALLYARALQQQEALALIGEERRRSALDKVRGRLARLDLAHAIRSLRQ